MDHWILDARVKVKDEQENSVSRNLASILLWTLLVCPIFHIKSIFPKKMFVICALVAASCTVVWSAKISVSVTCHSNTDCKIVESAGKIPGAYAHGTFDDDVLNSGWGKLWIHSEDSLQVRCRIL